MMYDNFGKDIVYAVLVILPRKYILNISIAKTSYSNSVKSTEFSFTLTPSCTNSKWVTPKIFLHVSAPHKV